MLEVSKKTYELAIKYDEAADLANDDKDRLENQMFMKMPLYVVPFFHMKRNIFWMENIIHLPVG